MTEQLWSKIIDDNHIVNSLDAILALFRSICEGRIISCSPDALSRMQAPMFPDDFALRGVAGSLGSVGMQQR